MARSLSFAEAVTPFTSDPDCVGLVWEGGEVQGGIAFYLDGRQSEKLPDPDFGELRVSPHGDRDTPHVPILGPLNEVHEIGIFTSEFGGETWQTNIDYWWPRSREWLVCSFVDFGANYVGCSRDCAKALLATVLQVREVAADSESRPAGPTR